MLLHLARTLWGPSGFLVETITPGHPLEPAWKAMQETGRNSFRVLLEKPLAANVLSPPLNAEPLNEIFLLREQMVVHGAARPAFALRIDDRGLTTYRRWQEDQREMERRYGR